VYFFRVVTPYSPSSLNRRFVITSPPQSIRSVRGLIKMRQSGRSRKLTGPVYCGLLISELNCTCTYCILVTCPSAVAKARQSTPIVGHCIGKSGSCCVTRCPLLWQPMRFSCKNAYIQFELQHLYIRCVEYVYSIGRSAVSE
jgi:hypothetical protein